MGRSSKCCWTWSPIFQLSKMFKARGVRRHCTSDILDVRKRYLLWCQESESIVDLWPGSCFHPVFRPRWPQQNLNARFRKSIADENAENEDPSHLVFLTLACFQVSRFPGTYNAVYLFSRLLKGISGTWDKDDNYILIHLECSPDHLDSWNILEQF